MNKNNSLDASLGQLPATKSQEVTPQSPQPEELIDPDSYRLPCEVKLPGVTLRKGVTLSTLLFAMERRKGTPSMQSFDAPDNHEWEDHCGDLDCEICAPRF